MCVWYLNVVCCAVLGPEIFLSTNKQQLQKGKVLDKSITVFQEVCKQFEEEKENGDNEDDADD